MSKLKYEYREAPTIESIRYVGSKILIIIQSGATFRGYVRMVDEDAGYTSSFEFVELWWDEISKRVRGISGFSVFDSTEGEFIEGSCSVSSFKNNNHSLALFSDNRQGSKYYKQVVARELVYPLIEGGRRQCRQPFSGLFKKFKK